MKKYYVLIIIIKHIGQYFSASYNSMRSGRSIRTEVQQRGC